MPTPGQEGIFFTTFLVEDSGIGTDALFERLKTLGASEKIQASGWVKDEQNNYVMSITSIQGDVTG